MIIETSNICIDYVYTKEKKSFIAPAYESTDINKVEIWCEAIEDWLDVTQVESEKLDKLITSLIQENESLLPENDLKQ